MKTECQGVFGRIFGHKFVAQYNLTPPADLGNVKGSHAGVLDVIDALTAKQYVCSVCQRCGQRTAGGTP